MKLIDKLILVWSFVLVVLVYWQATRLIEILTDIYSAV